MPRLELIYAPTCPNVAAARSLLKRACAKSGIDPRWQEWSSEDPAAPAIARDYGSPTILIDGMDVAGQEPVPGSSSCRLYAHGERGLRGVPTLEQVVARLGGSVERQASDGGGWRGSGAMVPAIAMSFLPKLACPACWPAYAGFMSSIGLGFLVDVRVLLPLTVAFLLVAVGALAFRARRRRGYGPFCVGVLAAAVVLVGKFALDLDTAIYAGVALLISASLWNGWPRRTESNGCTSCAPVEEMERS